MIVEKIKILNFGPFHGEHEITFPKDGSGVHLIRGDNGQGKTSIQRAILWALYGKVYDRKGHAIRPTSLLNWTAHKDDIYQFGVAVYFNHENKKWVISRKMEARSHSDKLYETGMKVSIVRDGEPEPNPEHVIRRIIPEDVSRFFFFDGEMLRDYEELLDQSSPSMALLRDSIEHVLGIPYLRIARDDLYQVQRKIENERARLTKRLGGKEYEELVNDFQAISDEIDRRTTEVKNLEKQMAQIELEISDKKRRLADIKSVQKLANDRNKLDEEIKQQEALREKEMELLRKLTSELYKTILVKSAEDIIARLQNKHKDAMEKYNQKQQLIGQAEQLEKAIGVQKCKLCGTVLTEAKLKTLQEELRDVKIKIDNLTEIPEPNLEFDNSMNRLRQLQTKMINSKDFKRVESTQTEIDHKLSMLKAKLDRVKEQLVGVDEKEPRTLELEIESMTKELGRLNGLKSAEEQRKLEDLELKADLDKKLSSIDKEELSVLAKRIEVIKSIAEIFEEAVSKYRDERREYVGSVASQIFCDLRTKPSFSKLSINKQFGLNIVTEDGYVLDRAEWRSSGEEQVVALALISALNRCAHIQAPVFMDTPFGRLDTKHGKKVLTFLPKLADQVVLLVTDRELRKEDEHYIAAHVKSDYTVIHKNKSEGSFIAGTISQEG